jgi:broad specificity phosphatase PhoE
MRHGQASFGTSHYDRLSPDGCAQAKAAGRFVLEQGRHFDLLCVGPRERHRDTADLLLDAWGHAPARQAEPALDEFADSSSLMLERAPAAHVTAGGEPALGPRPRVQLQQLLERIGAWADGELALRDGPTFREFRARVGRWARERLRQDEEAASAGHARHTLAVTSAGVIAATVCELMDLPDSLFLPLVSQVRNASFTEFAMWRYRPVMVSFNGTAHLPAQLLTHI